MNYRNWQLIFLSILISLYSLLFYFIFNGQYRLDFSSFYSANLALMAGKNPYMNLIANYLPPARRLLTANLNPPITLWLFTPLVHFNHRTAVIIWTTLSLIAGLISAGIAFNQAFSSKFLKENSLSLYLVYLSLFSSFINIAIGQIGNFLSFFIMVGYHFYLKKRNVLAGIFWGFIIAVKFFPGLLFFYVLKQGRFKVFAFMVASFLITCLIPLLAYGPTIYQQYYSMMTQVLWYGDNWNASIYGFIFRVLIDTPAHAKSFVLVKTVYVISFFILLIGYLKKLGPSEINHQINHQPFALTLVMMLLMSPFGWLYYFSLLVFPLALIWIVAANEQTSSKKTMILWLLCLFLINFPMNYIGTKEMFGFIERINFLSYYFYGLLLLSYLLMQKEKIPSKNTVIINKNTRVLLISPLLIILVFGMLSINASLILRLF
jgi:alpha-1,2-mannosyltransferase